MEQLYDQRLKRYVTALRNEKPDMVPIRPFVAEFTAKYSGMTSQEVTHDFNKAYSNNLALVKRAMAMWNYFIALGGQAAALREFG